MADDRSVLRWISWRDCCPWVVLPRAVTVSLSPRALLLATAGALLMSCGWWLAGFALFGPDNVRFPRGGDPAVPISDQVTTMAVDDPGWGVDRVPQQWNWLVDRLPRQPMYVVWSNLSEPFVQWFNPRHGRWELTYYLCGSLWTLVVWALFGGALTRIAVVKLGRDERVGLVESIRYASRYLLSYVGGPLFPLFGILIVAIPILILGLIMRLDVGVVVAGLLWVFVILAGILMAILALGLLFGWPLMWGTISSEGSDAFDSLSRCFAYTFQRPLHYAFYIFIAVLSGWIGWMLVSLFSETIIDLTFWAAGWGAGHERINASEIAHALRGTGEGSQAFSFGACLIGFWVVCVRTVATCWQYAFFFIAFGGVYLLLRRDVDQTETDEVYVEEGNETYGMPPLKPDDKGVPEPADLPKETPPRDDRAADESANSGDAE